MKTDFARNARGFWTACIAGTVPMAMLMVVHLGFFKVLCLLFRTKELQDPRFTLPVRPADYFCGGLGDPPIKLTVLREALSHWQGFTNHPAIQYVYLFLILAGALALCAALPSVTAEINPRLRVSEHVSENLGTATSKMFDLLRLSGEIVQRYVVIAIPVVVWHVWRVHHRLKHPFLIPVSYCWVGIIVLGALYISFRLHQEFKAKPRNKAKPVLAAGLSVAIVVGCFALPAFQEQINLTWLLGVSALFILAGAAFLFAPVISVGVDVTSWLQEYPEHRTPRARILARLIALLDHLKQNYEGVAIVAHSQGTMVVIEALRYLGCAAPDDYKGFNISLFTLGCPLRQLYAVRFPWLYDLIANLEKPPRVVAWTNVYGAGDYIGRNLWHSEKGAFTQGKSSDPNPQQQDQTRTEFCLGAYAHVHYWDWRNVLVAKELHRIVMDLKNRPSAQPRSTDNPI